MADPRQVIPTLTSEEIFALADNSQMATGTNPSRRALRSTATTGITSSTSSPAEKPSAPPALPGTKKSTKRILLDHIEAVDAPEQPPQPPPQQPLPQPTTQLTQTALQSLPTTRYVCNWAQGLQCEYPALQPLECQIDGCTRRVHHLCQGEWERRNLHPDVIARLCCLHHPHYKYANAPEKNFSPTRSSFPPNEVFPTASPADSSMTGAAAIATTPVKNNRNSKRKKTTLKAPPLEESTSAKRKRTTKGAAAGTGKKKPPGSTRQMDADEEGTADDANLSRKKPPESTQQMKKMSSASKVKDPRMFEEENAMDSELGDMGDSDDGGAEADIHNEGVSLREVLESSNEPIGDDADNIDDLKGEEFSPAEGNGVVQLVGAPDGWVPPGPPPTWAGYQPKGNAPELGDVDNPGNWSLYSFCPKYKTGSVYSGHFTPAGAMVLPVNEHGERELNGWRFHYQGWTPDAFDKSTYVRGEATQHDLKPDSRKGSLDANILRKHGCDADRVRDDPLFFYQLLFPFCPPESSGIEDDS